MHGSTAVTDSWRSAEQINSAMLRVYNHMALAVAVSAIVAGLVASSPAAMAFLYTGVMQWIVLFAPLAAIFGVTIALNANPSREIAALLLHGFAALMGLSMGAIVHVGRDALGHDAVTRMISNALDAHVVIAGVNGNARPPVMAEFDELEPGSGLGDVGFHEAVSAFGAPVGARGGGSRVGEGLSNGAKERRGVLTNPRTSTPPRA